MTDLANTPSGQPLRDGGEKVVQSGGFEWLSRAGFVARGLIYGIVGILALKLAVGQGGKTTNQQGALHTNAVSCCSQARTTRRYRPLRARISFATSAWS